MSQRDTPLFWEIGSFYNSLRVKRLSFTVFKSIQPIFWYLEELIYNTYTSIMSLDDFTVTTSVL